MSEEISYSNYLYQGQVYSPAFSDPPSPSSPMSTTSDTTVASSTQIDNCDSERSSSVISSDMSPTNNEPKPCSASTTNIENDRLALPSSISSDNKRSDCIATKTSYQNDREDLLFQTAQNPFSSLQNNLSRPKFPTKYHEMLQPLSPVTTLPVESVIRRPLPNKTHITEHDIHLQKKFHSLVDSAATCQVSKTTATAEDNEKELALTRVSSLEDFLLRHSENIDVNQYNDDGQTALQQSCLAGNLSLVKLLVRFGANMRLTTREGFSILHIAAFSGHSDLLNFVMGQHQNGR